MGEADPYLLGYRRAEQERLERQADELAHESAWLFDQIGVRDGWRVVEIGCGPRGCLGLLSPRVGPSGRVVGVERSDEQRVPRMLRGAGLVDVRVNPLVHVYPPGHGRRRMGLEFVENARSRIIEKDLVGEDELDELTVALGRHLEDPGTLVVSSLFIQAWGRKPPRDP